MQNIKNETESKTEHVNLTIIQFVFTFIMTVTKASYVKNVKQAHRKKEMQWKRFKQKVKECTRERIRKL